MKLVFVTLRHDDDETEVTGVFSTEDQAELFNQQLELEDTPIRPHGASSPYTYAVEGFPLDETHEARTEWLELAEAFEHAASKDD